MRYTALNMLDSLDILFIVLAFCALWFTAFLCWLLFQAASLVRRIHGIVDELKEKVVKLEDSISSMKRKFDGNIALVTGIADGVRKIIDAMRSKERDPERHDEG